LIGYYVHHQGRGHLARATSICAQLTQPVTVLTSLPVAEPHPFDAVLRLPRDDESDAAVDPTACGVLHWAPLHDNGLRLRMQAIADWVATERPAAVVIDVSVEVATFIRLLGVPVIVVAMPGRRTDRPHRLVYDLADHILAAWPRALHEPDWLSPHAGKTTYVGGISRFDGRARPAVRRPGPGRVLTLGGAGGSSVDARMIERCARDHPRFEWSAVGVAGGRWIEDPWDDLCDADVVVAHAGQSSVADIAAAARPAIVVPAPRPFDEQDVTAAVLRRAGLAVSVAGWPQSDQWEDLIARALAIDVDGWQRWQTSGAATRAAAAIDEVAARRVPVPAP
jgi:UDP-N-acetylglucosamine:LPS N-acetylglucosamine transferase